MGNRRSVEKALEHVGARATVSSRPDELRRAAGLVVPGVGAFPRAMEQPGRARPGRAAPRARRRRGLPCWASAWACSSPSSYSTEQGGADGLGLVAGEVRPLAADGAEASAHRLERGGLRDRRLGAARRPAGCGAPSTTCTPTRRCPRDEQDVLGRPSMGRRSSRPLSRAPSTACSFTPRSPRPPACACSPTSPEFASPRSRRPALRPAAGEAAR